MILHINPIKLAKYALASWVPGGPCHCVMCGHRVWRFMPYRAGSSGAPQLSCVLVVIGSDIDHFECPHCGAHDRERHLLLYLRATGLLVAMQGKAVLHFAPEEHLSRYIEDAVPARYVRCDLHPRVSHVQRVDMLDMPFDNESFDFVIANHVLEHVSDDFKALAEVHRVLKIGSYAILQTPYSPVLHHTWSDPGITTSSARLQAYGQEDHVRLFGRDIFERFETCGFLSQKSKHDDLLPDKDAYHLGVNRNEPFFLFRKLGIGKTS